MEKTFPRCLFQQNARRDSPERIPVAERFARNMARYLLCVYFELGQEEEKATDTFCRQRPSGASHKKVIVFTPHSVPLNDYLARKER